jgi:acetyltransferase-like isoleucine patch superfamily enzyme
LKNIPPPQNAASESSASSVKTHWAAPAQFFDLSHAGPLAERLKDLHFVFEIPDKLASWIEESIKPNAILIPRNGGLVERPYALLNGEAAPCESRLDGVSGKLEAFVNGQLLPPEAALVMPGAFILGDNVEIGPGVLIESGAFVKGPAILGPFTQVRQGAYVRGQTYCLEKAVVGHATEAKNVLFLSGAKAGHFAYLGDSVLGRETNLGAGTKLANLNFDGQRVVFKAEGEIVELSRRKFGAVLGDGCETGCNSVTNPGVFLGQGSRLYPNQTAKAGFYPANSRIKGESRGLKRSPGN